ncbi:ubiquitin-specific protease ubp2, partial [Tulasnella sp. 417]
MEGITPRPGPGCLPPRAATEIHGTFHQLYKVTVNPPSFSPTDGQPAANPQRSPLIGQAGSSAGPSTSSASLAQHRPPSESEVRYLIPHPYVQFCRRDMVWVYHQVKSSMYLPQLVPNSGTLPSDVVRKATSTCVEVDETGIRDMSFSSSKAKTHHFHHYPKSVKGSSLNPPFVRRKIDLETAAAEKRRRASSASSSSRHRAEATSAPTSQSTEILLDLWVCCQCQTYVISSGDEAVIPSILDGVLLQRYIRDREAEPTARPSKEESVIYSLETVLRIIENFLFKLDNRMVKVGPNLIKKIGWTAAAQEFLAFLGFQHSPVLASETESHPEGRLNPPKLAEGSPENDMPRAKLLQSWLELSIITQHYRKKHDRALQGYEAPHKMWVSIENTFDETRRQIGAHETQIKQMPLTQSQLIHQQARVFWDGLGTTPETHSSEVVKFAYRRQTHCDPRNTPYYFSLLKGLSGWAARIQHSSAEALQILVIQEES